MKQAILLRVVWATVMSFAMAWTGPVLAQRGGHSVGVHPGGGFHGGHGNPAGGARFYGGYRGGSPGSRVAYSYGWHGGYWGYPRYRYGWGWGSAIGFGWPVWPTYAYVYA